MILSIDYGEKYVGLAIADSKLKLAIPYKVLVGRDEKILLEKLKEIIIAEKIKKIIVGKPVSLSGKITEQTRRTDKFIKKLKKIFKLPVIDFDERLTSKLANQNIINLKNGIHAFSAAIILEDYLKNVKFKMRGKK